MSDANAGAGGGNAPLLGGEPPPAGGAPPADGRDWLPEAFRANPVFKDITNVEGLAKSYDNAARLVGLDKGAVLRLPAAEDAPEWGDVYARLGRPEKPDGYEFPKLPGELVEGVEPAAREAFHKLGLSAKQAKGVMELYGGQITAAETARIARGDAMEQAVVADLRREWGDAFDDRVHAANRAIAEVGGKDLGKLLQETVMPDGTRMGNHPLLIKAFAEFGKRIGEPGDLRGGSGGGGANGALTPADAQAEIAKLRADPTFLKEFGNNRHANYPAHKANWDKLHKAAFPDS